jgi:protein phosphatase
MNRMQANGSSLGGAYTHQGRRKNNQDAVALPPALEPQRLAQSGVLYILADGLGGYQGGELASQTAINCMMQHFYGENPQVPLVDRLVNAVYEAHHEIRTIAQQDSRLAGMGTTLVAAAVKDGQFCVVNVGDSPALLIRDGQPPQVLTTAHSWVARQRAAGTITEEQARTHQMRNVVTMALGMEEAMRPSVQGPTPLMQGDILVLLSDGVSNFIDPQEVAAMVQQQGSNYQAAAQVLVEQALARESRDNCSAVIIPADLRVGAGAPAALAPVATAASAAPTREHSQVFPTAVVPLEEQTLNAPAPLPLPQQVSAQERQRQLIPILVAVLLLAVAVGVWGVLRPNAGSTVAGAQPTQPELAVAPSVQATDTQPPTVTTEPGQPTSTPPPTFTPPPNLVIDPDLSTDAASPTVPLSVNPDLVSEGRTPTAPPTSTNTPRPTNTAQPATSTPRRTTATLAPTNTPRPTTPPTNTRPPTNTLVPTNPPSPPTDTPVPATEVPSGPRTTVAPVLTLPVQGDTEPDASVDFAWNWSDDLQAGEYFQLWFSKDGGNYFQGGTSTGRGLTENLDGYTNGQSEGAWSWYVQVLDGSGRPMSSSQESTFAVRLTQPPTPEPPTPTTCIVIGPIQDCT